MGGRTDTALQGTSTGLGTSYLGHMEGDTVITVHNHRTEDAEHRTPDVTSVTHGSTKRLQNIYQTSLTLLAVIMQAADLKALLTAWQKTLTPGAKNQILALVKAANKLSGIKNTLASA